jgi:hypothetical protein
LIRRAIGGQPTDLAAGGRLAAYDSTDGRGIRRVTCPEGFSVVPRPGFAHDLLFLSSGFIRPVIYAIKILKHTIFLRFNSHLWRIGNRDRPIRHIPEALPRPSSVAWNGSSGVDPDSKIESLGDFSFVHKRTRR